MQLISRRQFLQKSTTAIVNSATESTSYSPALPVNSAKSLPNTITKLINIPKALAEDTTMPRRNFLIWFRQIFS